MLLLWTYHFSSFSLCTFPLSARHGPLSSYVFPLVFSAEACAYLLNDIYRSLSFAIVAYLLDFRFDSQGYLLSDSRNVRNC